ncbi:MAG TPA: glycosyltransferase [Candidatus Sericytochromatia bacterium]
MPIISVIIPSYNAEKTIKETIQSVLNQTWQDFELLIINDGSQDATLEVIESIQDPRIKIFSYPNAGSSASRNRGIAIAKGEYISFIDADDLWTADKLEAQYKALQENSQAAVAYSWTDHIDESGQFLRSGPQQSFTGDVYARLLLEDFIGNGSNPLIRAQAFAEVGDFDESLAHSEDWDLWLRLAARYHFVAVPSPQILYRMCVSSKSFNIKEMEESSLQVIERAVTATPETIGHLKQASLGNRYKFLTWKALDGTPEQRRALTALRLLWHTIRNDPPLLYKRIVWKVVLKIAIALLLPPQAALLLLEKMGRLSNLDTLFIHKQSEPF